MSFDESMTNAKAVKSRMLLSVLRPEPDLPEAPRIWCNTMSCKLRLRRVAIVISLILMCAIAGCSRRRAVVATPPPAPAAASATAPMPRAADVRPDVPTAPQRREVAVLFKNGAGYTEVVTQLKKLLPIETFRLTLIDVEAENSQKLLDSLRSRPGLVAVAVSLPAARIARDQLNV